MDEQPISRTLTILAFVMFLFLLAPVVIVLPLSFSGDVTMALPPSHWSTRWYTAIFADKKMISSFVFSLWLALAVTVIDLLFAIPAAFMLIRRENRFSATLMNVFTAPLLLPTIVLGIAILIVFSRMGMLGSGWSLLFAHLVVTLPYALRVLCTALSNLPLAIEEAAATLGASPMTVFRRITFPLLVPGIVATGALCFLVSFDEVVLSLFLTGPNATTLPVAMYHHVETRADPLVAALSVLLVAFTLLVVLVVDRSLGLARTFVK